jgi:hypothetical protein
MTLDYAMWIVTAASLVGTVANIKKRRGCFTVWIVTNTIWAAYDLSIGAFAQAALMATYAVLSVWGAIAWRAPENGRGHRDRRFGPSLDKYVQELRKEILRLTWRVEELEKSRGINEPR